MYRCYSPVISSRVKGEAERSEPQVCLWGPARNNISLSDIKSHALGKWCIMYWDRNAQYEKVIPSSVKPESLQIPFMKIVLN